MRYATAAAFRDALEHRLRARATEHLLGVNVLHKQVAIDLFLARLTIAAPGSLGGEGSVRARPTPRLPRSSNARRRPHTKR